MRAQASGRLARRIGLLALLIGIGATVVAAASAQDVGPGGGSLPPGCSNSGTTPSWDNANSVSVAPCFSREAWFYGYKNNWGAGCIYGADGYNAHVLFLPNGPGSIGGATETWHNFYCNDGVWHHSDIYGQNKWRMTTMTVGAGVYWAMQMIAW